VDSSEEVNVSGKKLLGAAARVPLNLWFWPNHGAKVNKKVGHAHLILFYEPLFPQIGKVWYSLNISSRFK
jgi:hypothetical protein